MAAKTKKSSTKYLIVLAGLGVYVISLILAAFLYHVDIVWLFYGLIPSTISIYLALHGYQESHHAENHLRRISDDILAVRMYVEEIVGVPGEFDK